LTIIPSSRTTQSTKNCCLKSKMVDCLVFNIGENHFSALFLFKIYTCGSIKGNGVFPFTLKLNLNHVDNFFPFGFLYTSHVSCIYYVVMIIVVMKGLIVERIFMLIIESD
jgi:hypothetical protein